VAALLYFTWVAPCRADTQTLAPVCRQPGLHSFVILLNFFYQTSAPVCRQADLQGLKEIILNISIAQQVKLFFAAAWSTGQRHKSFG
jgi:hypothetical protein